MKIKNIIILVTMFVLLINLSYSVENDNYFNPKVDVWYSVTDWELDVCRKKAVEGYPNEYISTLPYMSQLTISLQGEKTDYGEEVEEDRYLYEVSYYIQPLEGYVEFAVKLRNSETEKIHKVIRPRSTDEYGASGYKVFYSNEDYDQVQMGYFEEGASDKEIVTVPIIPNTGLYVLPGGTGTTPGGEPIWGDDW